MSYKIFIDENSSELARKIATWMLQKKYFPADEHGRPLKKITNNSSFGILCINTDEDDFGRRNRFSRKAPQFTLLGQVAFLGLDGRVASEWGLCVNGDGNGEKVEKLIEDLSKRFSVSITTNLRLRTDNGKCLF